MKANPSLFALAIIKLHEITSNYTDIQKNQFCCLLELYTYVDDGLILKKTTDFDDVILKVRESQLFLSFDLEFERFVYRTFAKMVNFK